MSDIAVTPRPNSFDKQALIDCGMNGFLSKPIIIEELVHELQKIL